MSVIHRQFCDWCGKEVSPYKFLHGTKIFPVKKRYWIYEGYSIEIDNDDNYLVDDMICDDCKKELLAFVRTLKATKKGAE